MSLDEAMDMLQKWCKTPGNIILWENNTMVDVSIKNDTLIFRDTFDRDPIALYSVEPDNYKGGFRVTDVDGHRGLIDYYFMFDSEKQILTIISVKGQVACTLTLYKAWGTV